MRFDARLAGVVLLVVASAACDKAQIAQLESQTATITITTTNTVAELFNVWDLIEDNDGDEAPDDGTYLYCESVPVNLGQPPRTVPVQAPWNHSLRISVLRADATEFEQVSDADYLGSLSNLTPYDDQILTGNAVNKPNLTISEGTCSITPQACSFDTDCPATETCVLVNRTFKWRNPRQMSAVNMTVLQATSNPLHEINPSLYRFRNGLCSVSTFPGPASLGGAPQPFIFELGKGDTLKVEARKSLTPPDGIIDDSNPAQPLTTLQPELIGQLAIDGVMITNLGGDASSTTAVGDGFSFFYRSR